MPKVDRKTVIYFLCAIAMPGIAKSKCTSTMGKQVVHCTGNMASIQELNEEIDSTTSVIVLKDLNGLTISPEEHVNENFKSVTSYQLLRIGSLELAKDSFTGLNNLIILKISDSRVDRLVGDVFRGLHFLEILELINCDIERIDDKAFSGLNNLQSLDLTNNRIQTISKRLLQNLSNLNSLALYRNEIATLDIDCFKGLRRLTTLGLAENNLKVVNADVFNVIPKLTYLYLSMNEIYIINGYFNCPNLKFINLNHNKIENISRSLFRYSTNLIDIDLAFNDLVYIDPDTFNGLPKLMNLHLKNCNVDISNLNFVNKPLIVV